MRDGAFTDSLVDFDPDSRRFVPSCRSGGPPGDIGVLSPDGKTYAYANSAAARAKLTILSCRPGNSPVIRTIVDSASEAGRSWYTSLSWSPLGGSILATRIWQEGSRFYSEVRLLRLADGATATVLPSTEGPIGAVFVSENTAIALGRKGLVRFDLNAGRTTVAFPKLAFGNMQYKGGGIAWMPKSQSVALGLLNPAADRAEIWKVHLADRQVRVLYAKKNALFFNVLCIESR